MKREVFIPDVSDGLTIEVDQITGTRTGATLVTIRLYSGIDVSIALTIPEAMKLLRSLRDILRDYHGHEAT